MKHTLAAATAVLATAASAQVVRVWSYEGPNGESSRTADFWDDTYTFRDGTMPVLDSLSPLSGGLGQLTDGIVGVDDWRVDLGNGPWFEWVGWRTPSPTLIFDLGWVRPVTGVSVFVNNAGIGAERLYESLSVRFSEDKVSWAFPETFTTTTAERNDPSARYIDELFAAQRTARYVEVTFIDSDPLAWIFIAEVSFIPTPSASMACLIGAVAVLRSRMFGALPGSRRAIAPAG